jgi:hypothetical protein
VKLAGLQRLEDEQIERSLEEVGLAGAHGRPIDIL